MDLKIKSHIPIRKFFLGPESESLRYLIKLIKIMTIFLTKYKFLKTLIDEFNSSTYNIITSEIKSNRP